MSFSLGYLEIVLLEKRSVPYTLLNRVSKLYESAFSISFASGVIALARILCSELKF